MSQANQSNENPRRELAFQFANHTDRHIFLTGKAGTGKTTFLRQLQEHSPKRLIVTAPTGVAAINARGETLHSFFQLPFGPFVPENTQPTRRIRKEKLNIIQSLELLIIDEISMVRADVLDAIDDVLRRVRRSNIPFGGVQLLMIGDIHQLSPVVQRDEEPLLRKHYQSVYFFGSNALRKTCFVSIELNHIYRQSDPVFINLLNQVRENKLDNANLALLNQRYSPTPAHKTGELPITLSTHNQTADTINRSQLQALSTQEFQFEAVIQDDYPEHLYPQPCSLRLKINAQVMFTRNDHSGDKRYYNGKIGRVTRVDDDVIFVHCPDDNSTIMVSPSVWENIHYTVNEENKLIESRVVGTFTQYPLMLAWAITIHKSQGLTFDNIIIDAQNAFAHGQVYVALSRCRRLEGIQLLSPLQVQAIRTDSHVASFTQEIAHAVPTANDLKLAKIQFQQKLLLKCFDFSEINASCSKLLALSENYPSIIQLSTTPNILEFHTTFNKNIVTVGKKFTKELQTYLSEDEEPDENTQITSRTQKAFTYFSDKFQTLLFPWLDSISWQTDNKDINRQARNIYKELQNQAKQLSKGINSCKSGFKSKDYLHALSIAMIDSDSGNIAESKKDPSNLTHPALYRQLKEWRNETAELLGVSPAAVVHQRILQMCSENLPTNRSELKKITDVGPKTIQNYGEALLSIINNFVEKENLSGQNRAKNTKKQPSVSKPNTRLTSYKLFRDGMSIEQIAKHRGLVNSTIEGHLIDFIQSGEIAIEELLEIEMIIEIEKSLLRYGHEGLKAVKEKLPDEISYGQIKMVAAAMGDER